MFLGTGLFLVVMLLVAPQSRLFLETCLASGGGFIHAYAPFSYVLILLPPVAMIGSMFVLRTWPKTPDPENPMAKYKNDRPYEE
jgi:hypothetical protein